MKKSTELVLLVLVFLTLLLSGCAFASTPVPPTSTSTITLTPTLTPSPTITLTPTLTLTPTPTEPPKRFEIQLLSIKRSRKLTVSSGTLSPKDSAHELLMIETRMVNLTGEEASILVLQKTAILTNADNEEYYLSGILSNDNLKLAEEIDLSKSSFTVEVINVTTSPDGQIITFIFSVPIGELVRTISFSEGDVFDVSHTPEQ